MRRREVEERLARVLPPGYTLDRSTGGHAAIMKPDGSQLRAESGLPIRVSLSPRDYRGLRNTLARIEKALD